MGERNDDVSPTTLIDLTNCDREPIHIPGAVQPYGALLVLNPSSLEIFQASQSCLAHLGLAPTELVGKSVEVMFGSKAAANVATMLASGVQGAFCRMQLGNAPSRDFNAFIHRSEGVAILEIEPASSTETVTVERIGSLMRDTVRRLERAESMIELAQDIADEMRALTSFDRIWVYRFHPDWHGEIIGESKGPDIETWLGMHYPASDIPAQARALFLRNWLRVIPDVGFVPSPIEPAHNPISGQPLDLGGSLLRSASPIHVQYLTNMGVTASMVISLIHRGKLWGLISGHHYSGPKRLPHAERALCEFLAQALSLQIGATDRVDDQSYALEIRPRGDRLIERLGLDASPVVLAADDELLAEMVSASGAMVVHGGEYAPVGATPNRDQVGALVAWLRTMSDDSYETSALPTEFPPAAGYAGIASGLLAVPLTRDRRDFLLWFRGEQRQTVRWAGDPRKPVTIGKDGSARLHPRGSFALWEEEARGTAGPWRPSEIKAALDLRRAVLDVQIRRSEQVVRLNEELHVTNVRLEESAVELELRAAALLEQRKQREALLAREQAARVESDRANRAKSDFLAMMSHELRTPLNAIGGYAQLISLGIRGGVTPEQASDLERIQINQRHLLGLINSILNFTKLEAGQIQFKLTTVELMPLLLGLHDLIGPQMLAKSIRLTVLECGSGLHVRADDEKLRQILLNLLTNALKFTGRGGAVSISCHAEAGRVDISVSDTGRGIDSEQLASAFEPFLQIDRHLTPESEQGVGLGLSISRELARGMDGDLRATSEVGVGSTFTLSIPLAT